MKIRPVSDLRNKFPEIEAELNENGYLFLTKNGYGTAVLMNIDEYMRLNESVQPLANYSAKTNKLSKDRPKSKSGFGLLSSYADPDKIESENLAGKLHALKKFGGVANE